MTERDEKFFQSATRLWDKMLGQYRCIDVSTGWTSELDPEDEEHKKYITMIAQYAYDLVESGCMAISDQQMRQGVRLHPYAMMRAIPDMTTSNTGEKNTQQSP